MTEQEKETTLDTAVQRAVDWAVTVDSDEMKERVARLRTQYPHWNRRQLADKLIERSKWWAASVGALTGLPGTVLVAVPAVVGNVALLLRREVELAAQIGLLFDPNFLDGDEPHYELLVPVVGQHMISQALRETAVLGTMGVTRTFIRENLAKQTLREFKKLVSRWFGVRVTQPQVIARVVPFVGAVVGGGWNYLEMQRVGKRAYAYFKDEKFD